MSSLSPYIRANSYSWDPSGVTIVLKHRCINKTLLQFCPLYFSAVCCMNAMEKKQLQLYTLASSIFSVTASLGRSVRPAVVVPLGQQGTTTKN